MVEELEREWIAFEQRISTDKIRIVKSFKAPKPDNK